MFGIDVNDWDLEFDELEAQAAECKLDKEQAKTVVDLESRVGSLEEISSVETHAATGHIANVAVIVNVAAVVNVAVTVNTTATNVVKVVTKASVGVGH